MQLILGSNSPRRKEILDFFSIPFLQISPDFDESEVAFDGDPAAYVTEIAIRKTQILREKHPDSIILTADTTVYREQRLFQKPANFQEACAMLRELSGKEHQVFTGVAVAHRNTIDSAFEETRVFFSDLTDDQIHRYIQAFHPYDKAGAYAIQKGGSLIVKRIEGCYYNVMGLPLQTVRRMLRKAGIDLWDFFKPI